MNLPNKLTLIRMIMVPFVVILMLPMPFSSATTWNQWVAGPIANWAALILFIVAALTDLFDGKIARKYNLVTNFGKFMDPLADKLLVISALVVLTQLGHVHSFVTIIIIARELIVTGIRTLAAEKGIVIAASNLGKIKAVSQDVAIIYIMLENALIASKVVFPLTALVGNILVFVATVLTLISGWDYVYRNRKLVSDY